MIKKIDCLAFIETCVNFYFLKQNNWNSSLAVSVQQEAKQTLLTAFFVNLY